MNPFLYYVAQDLIKRYGNNLSEVTIVFPGKRAELYMNSFLSYFAQGPVWAPRFRTIDELFQQMSPLTASDNILNVCRLYRIYAQIVTKAEPLDEFYGWGEILMNDFNDIDKHLVDANALFANATDLAALEATDYLSEEQTEALKQFFANFDPERQTELKQRFLEMWKAMPEMYRRLKEELRNEGLMYKGGLYREVAEHIQDEIRKMKGGMCCFVGFNVLDEVEETLFTALRDAGKALFYWDYDAYYAAQDSDHEAGLFLRHNLQHYPSALADDIYHNLRSPGKQIRILSSTTDNAQVRFLPQWIKSLSEEQRRSAAIVLCDEALMRPTLHSIPDGTEVNITMGFPLTDTAIHGYFSALIDLQTDGYNQETQHFLPSAMERVEKNPFFTTFPQEMRPLQHTTDTITLIDWLLAATESLGHSLATMEAPTPYDQLYAEATFQLYKILNQFRWLVADGTLSVRPNTLRRLIRQALQSASIPFHGDMDRGIQIMGLLEARNLDFRHLIMLSVGEGTLPRRSSGASLIPYILRTHFGLNTVEHQDSVYAYSFYRLLQRAEHVTLVYNENSSGVSQREQSRFLRQLVTETGLPIEQGKLEAPFTVIPTFPITKEKDEHIMHALQAKKSISPSAINTYVKCPLMFYFGQVANLRMPNRPQDGIDNALLGTIFHDTCELFYTHLCRIKGNKVVERASLGPLFKENEQSPIQAYVDLMLWADYIHGLTYDSRTCKAEREAFLAPFLATNDWHSFSKKVCDLYGGPEARDQQFTGVNIIIRSVLVRLVNQLLRWDMEHTPFTIYGMEEDAYMDFIIPSGDTNVKLKVGGRIDRMDIMNIDGQDTLRVVDYKTGKEKKALSNIEDIFNAKKSAHGYYLQTLLYSLVMSQREQRPVSPSLFYVFAAKDARGYNPTLQLNRQPVHDIRDVAKEYREGLCNVLNEIYDPDIPFTQTDDEQNTCKYCDFRRLCGR